MKEKISLCAKGIFEYQRIPLKFSPSRLTLEVDAGETWKGSFTISNEEERPMKGMVCTECHYLELEEDVFQGTEPEITFIFHGENLLPGKVVSGRFEIISDQGSGVLPFSITISVPSCNGSTGKLCDLFQFANLAAENPREAVQLFQNPHFERVFLQKDSFNQEIYRGMVKSHSPALAMEEFLIAVHKKVPVELNLEKNTYFYEDCREEFQDRIVLEKNTWGIEEFEVEADGAFIEPEQRRIRTSQFVGNTFSLFFVVHPDKMRKGRNYGRITVSSARQSLEIQIEARKECDLEQVRAQIQEQRLILEQSLQQLKLSSFPQDSLEEEGESGIGAESPRRKYGELQEKLGRGCISPAVYQEMCRLLNRAPGLLMELTAEVERCLHWGCQNGCLNRELALRYSMLAGRHKSFSRILLEDMRLLYESYPGDDLLQIICKMQMNRRRVLEEDQEWYALGIRHNLKLTDLYEYYLYTMEEEIPQPLPGKVLLYFLYDNHLNAGKRADLYAYIIRCCSPEEEIYQEYRPVIEKFTFRQLQEGRISPALSVLYHQFLNEEKLTPELARRLPAVLFSYEITCYHSDIVGIYVHYRELEQEEFVPLIQGKAVVSIFTQAQLFLADRKGNRYVTSIDYTSRKLLQMDYLAERCMEYAPEDYRLLLHLYQKAEGMDQSGEYVAQLQERVLEIPNLSLRYRRRVFASRLRSCYDNFEGELLDRLLENMDWSQVEPEDRNQILEYCAVRHCDDKAMEGILEYGYGKLPAQRLLQVAGKTFRNAREDIQLVKLAWHIFDHGKFDENLLRYLCRYYVGSVHKMVQIWKAADGFEIPMADFQERILAQTVFTEEWEDEVCPVFYGYAENGRNKRLIRAFLKFAAYQYLVRQRAMPEEMFGYFIRRSQEEENLPCLVAALKYLSSRERSREETEFVSDHLPRLLERRMVFGFYKQFGEVPAAKPFQDQQFIEYIASPDCQVQLRWRIKSREETGAWQIQGMTDMFEGIRVSGFVLFQDEVLEYSVIETDPRGEQKETQLSELSFVPSGESGSSRYRLLNQMLSAREQKEEERLLDHMREYAEKKEFISRMIKPLS